MKSDALIIGVPTLLEALEMDREAIQIVGEMESGWLRLGRIVRKVADSRAYKVLGFATEADWLRARVRGSVSGALAAARSVRALEAAPEDKLVRIGAVNALLLADLPKEVRTSPEWLERAATLKTEEFRNLVRQESGVESEEFRTWALRLPKAVFDLGTDVEQEYAPLMGVDPGNRIELWARLFVFLKQQKPHVEVEIRDA